MTIPQLSSRALKTPPSPIRRLAGLATQATARGIKVCRLNIGQPDLPFPEVFQEGLDRAQKPILTYEASEGCPELLDSWSRYLNTQYDIGVTAAQMLITVGASEALIFAFMVCCDPGDEILIFDPTYANYIGFSAISGVRLIPLPCSLEAGFAMPSKGEIERFISPYTRAVLICNPNNPTGSVCSDEQLSMLVELCRERELFLIVDETYREFVYDNRKPRCIFELAPRDSNIIVVDSLSKRFSLCGARIGCLITWHPELRQAAFHIAQARLAAPSLEQRAAAYMIDTISQEYLAVAREEYQTRRDVALAALHRIPGVTAYAPQGGFYLLARLPVADAERFAVFMLQEFSHEGYTTFVAPAAGFYMHRDAGREAIRIAFVLDSAEIERGIIALGEGIRAYASSQRQAN